MTRLPLSFSAHDDEELGEELPPEKASRFYDSFIGGLAIRARIAFVLCLAAGLTAIERHAGALRYIYTPRGRQTIAEGKDLTKLKYLIGTGGALTRLPHHEQIFRISLFAAELQIQLLCIACSALL